MASPFVTIRIACLLSVALAAQNVDQPPMGKSQPMSVPQQPSKGWLSGWWSRSPQSPSTSKSPPYLPKSPDSSKSPDQSKSPTDLRRTSIDSTGSRTSQADYDEDDVNSIVSEFEDDLPKPDELTAELDEAERVKEKTTKTPSSQMVDKAVLLMPIQIVDDYSSEMSSTTKKDFDSEDDTRAVLNEDGDGIDAGEDDDSEDDGNDESEERLASDKDKGPLPTNLLPSHPEASKESTESDAEQSEAADIVPLDATSSTFVDADPVQPTETVPLVDSMSGLSDVIDSAAKPSALMDSTNTCADVLAQSAINPTTVLHSSAGSQLHDHIPPTTPDAQHDQGPVELESVSEASEPMVNLQPAPSSLSLLESAWEEARDTGERTAKITGTDDVDYHAYSSDEGIKGLPSPGPATPERTSENLPNDSTRMETSGTSDMNVPLIAVDESSSEEIVLQVAPVASSSLSSSSPSPASTSSSTAPIPHAQEEEVAEQGPNGNGGGNWVANNFPYFAWIDTFLGEVTRFFSSLYSRIARMWNGNPPAGGANNGTNAGSNLPRTASTASTASAIIATSPQSASELSSDEDTPERAHPSTSPRMLREKANRPRMGMPSAHQFNDEPSSSSEEQQRQLHSHGQLRPTSKDY